jgi:hypothetical protein
MDHSRDTHVHLVTLEKIVDIVLSVVYFFRHEHAACNRVAGGLHTGRTTP